VGDILALVAARDADRRRRLEAALRATFPDDAESNSNEIAFVRAPGRVNLMGDHTDYNDGFVLPIAIELDTWIATRRRRDRSVRIASLQSAEVAAFQIDDLEAGSGRSGGGIALENAASERLPGPRWTDYVAGTAWSLREGGLPIGGFDGVVDSTVPLGVGLASSAALELASAVALLAGERRVAAPHLAALAQRAEREYVGAECGLVDQFASAAGRAGRAILLDCRSLESRTVAMPEGLRVVICDAGVPRARLSSSLAERRAECGRAVALLAEREPSIASLRDVDLATLRRHRHALPEKLARRAEHVITENLRVRAVAVALALGDLHALGRIFAASHESLRTQFEASVPALDAMVTIATSVPGVVAARMTGPGFGGCTVNLVRDGAVSALARAVATEYPRRTGLVARLYEVAPVDGAGPLGGH
jgi:galactokinase